MKTLTFKIDVVCIHRTSPVELNQNQKLKNLLLQEHQKRKRDE